MPMEPVQLSTERLDEAVLALLSLCILSALPGQPGIQADPGFDYDSLKRLHAQGYLAACPHHPIHTIWLTPEGARRSRELFRKLFCDVRPLGT